MGRPGSCWLRNASAGLGGNGPVKSGTEEATPPALYFLEWEDRESSALTDNRPIAIGETLRRLTGKCICAIKDKSPLYCIACVHKVETNPC